MGERDGRDRGLALVPVAKALTGAGLDACHELVEREPPDPLAVHPVELLAVERRRGVRDVVEIERRDELAE